MSLDIFYRDLEGYGKICHGKKFSLKQSFKDAVEALDDRTKAAVVGYLIAVETGKLNRDVLGQNKINSVLEFLGLEGAEAPVNKEGVSLSMDNIVTAIAAKATQQPRPTFT